MLTADSQTVCRQIARVAVGFLKCYDADGYAQYKAAKYPGGAGASPATKEASYRLAMTLFAAHVSTASTTYSQEAHDIAEMMAAAFNAPSFEEKEDEPQD